MLSKQFQSQKRESINHFSVDQGSILKCGVVSIVNKVITDSATTVISTQCQGTNYEVHIQHSPLSHGGFYHRGTISINKNDHNGARCGSIRHGQIITKCLPHRCWPWRQICQVYLSRYHTKNRQTKQTDMKSPSVLTRTRSLTEENKQIYLDDYWNVSSQMYRMCNLISLSE